MIAGQIIKTIKEALKNKGIKTEIKETKKQTKR